MNVNTEEVDNVQDSPAWQKLWTIFQDALELEPARRREYLTDACGADDDLHREVLELLAEHEGTNILDTPPFLASVPPSESLQLSGSKPGDVLANRFELIRVLGQGGMARVYEAKDLDLGIRVALKILRGDIASNPEALERFKREVDLAIRITHPNVCRIYDLFHQDEFSFLTMQLLEGETLYERIQSSGPLNTGEAFPIVQQLAEALTAAHDLGIIHRDLKPTNVMLIPHDSETRAVLTDFGTAVAIADTRLTADGQFLGTPEYMAPEQVRGEDVSTATDVYALGLLMYEMVTGKQPFHGNTPFSIASSRLHSPVVSPRKINPELNRTWEKTILRCLERNPKDRIQTPAEVITALKGGPVSIRFATERRKKQIGAYLAMILVAMAIFAIVVNWPNTTQSVAALPFEKRDWLLISAFENKTGDPSFDALEFALRRELENSQFVNVVPTERIVDALALMRKPADTKVTSGIAKEICMRDAEIRAFLKGDIQKSGSDYIVHAQLVDPARDQAVATFNSEANSEDDLLKAMRRLSGDVRQKLGEQVSEIEKTEQKLDAVTTTSLRALQLYSQADYLMATKGDGPGAEKLLREAIALDPGFASAYTHLAWVISNEGKDGYLPYARRAVELSETVTDRERYFIQASYLEMSGKYEEAASKYQLLIHFFPDYHWPYNNLIDLLWNYLYRVDEVIPYILRRSEIRPNDFDAALHGAVFLWQIDPAKTETLLKRATQLAQQMPDPKLSILSVEAIRDSIKIRQFWNEGDLKSQLRLLKDWEGRIQSVSPGTYPIRSVMSYGYCGLGRFHDAREIQRLETNKQQRDYSLRLVELYLTPVHKWASVLRSHNLNEPPTADEAIWWSTAGLTSEAQNILSAVADPKPGDPLFQTVQGQIALKEGDAAMAVRMLEPAVETLRNRKLPDFYLASNSLATAWLRLGKAENAVRVLEKASNQKTKIMGGASRVWWMQNQLRLADLYSQVGRQADADKIFDDLRNRLTHADPDYWLVKELNRKASVRSNPPR